MTGKGPGKWVALTTWSAILSYVLLYLTLTSENAVLLTVMIPGAGICIVITIGLWVIAFLKGLKRKGAL